MLLLALVHRGVCGDMFDGIYDVLQVHVAVSFVRINAAPRTAVRSPGSFEAQMLSETMMDVVATASSRAVRLCVCAPCPSSIFPVPLAARDCLVRTCCVWAAPAGLRS